MKHFASKRAAFQLSPVAAGCAIFATILAGSAHAQTASTGEAANASANSNPAPVTTVTVTGIRRAIEDAIAVKRESTGIVEAISSEDIGKLPDVSIAESLARLPGLSAQRVNGQAQSISIRGTSGDLSTALLNGREQVTTSSDRTVEYDQYPSELINAVTVYKTGDASVIGQGLSGTVDLQTIKPLSLRERTVTVNVRGEKNSKGEISPGSPDTGSRVSASYIDQFANRTIGIALGYARQDKPNVGQQFETWDWVDQAAGSSVKVPKGMKSMAITGDQVRDGLMGVLEFRPNRNFSSTFDVYHSRFDQEEIRRGIEMPLKDDGSVTFSNGTVVDGTMVSGTANNVNPVVRNNRMTREDKLTAFGWNNRFSSGDWVGIVDISRSKADHKEELIEINAGLPTRQTLDFSYGGGTIPTLGLSGVYTDPALLRIGGQFGDGYVNAPQMTDKMTSARASIERKFDNAYFRSLELGFNVSKREKDKQHLETGFTKLGDGSLASDVLNGTQGLYGLQSSLTWDIDRLLGSNFAPFTPAVLVPWGATKNWAIEEKVKTGYAKLNIDTELMAMPLRGNIGIQVIETNQSSTAEALRRNGTGDDLVPVSDGKKYTDYLPSVNLAWSLPDQQFIRFGAGKTMARAKLNQLNAALEVGLTENTTGTPWGNGGNAQLDPWRAKQVDLSYEKYFGNKGYVSAAGFYKDLSSYIYNLTVPRDFSEFNFAGATSNIGTMTQPMNGEGGSLRGLELAASVPLEMVHPMLGGFGVSANASFTNSEISIVDQRFGSRAIPLPGLSKRVFNVTAYYENNGFSARVSQRYRSDFVGEIGGIGGATELTYVKADKVVDLQLGYDFKQIEGLSVLFQVNNLTDTAFRSYAGTEDRPRGYAKYGRQMLFGLNYKL